MEQRELTWLQERAFEDAFARIRRKTWVAYLLAVPLGCFGTHRFYLGRVRTGCIMFALWMVGFLLASAFSVFVHDSIMSVVGEVVAGLMMLTSWTWEVADFFLIPFIVRKVNVKIENGLRARLQAGQPV